jgi:DNA adenine methylase
MLPLTLSHTGVPPVKCQGIKTKLVPFIARSIRWAASKRGRWIEPFLGSGVVAFNLAPRRALLSDTNPHIVALYTDIQHGRLSADSARTFLECEGRALSQKGEKHYYEVRDRFNDSPSSLDFLFLNRSCFNGVMRFNRRGRFNVPFGHKPHRFDRSFLTRVANQIAWAREQIGRRDWKFVCGDWRETLAGSADDDFVYLDPPYAGRHADYFGTWGDKDADALAAAVRLVDCGYALSTWSKNRHRRNVHVDQRWQDHEIRFASHFYHVGSTEDLRNDMLEALIIKPGFATETLGVYQTRRARAEVQPELPITVA